jgi:hypothetical protein
MLDSRISGFSTRQVAELPNPLNMIPYTFISSFAYEVTFGIPSVVMLMPYALAFGGRWVSTASAFELTLLA